ncbi:MAG: helix-turn-helix domain-containing protein [Verrucomicrobiota bacterium]
MVFIKDPEEVHDPAPALTRGLDILQILEEEGPASLEFLSQHTGWPKSSIARLLQSLENYGAIVRDSFTKLYTTQLRLIPSSPEETLLRDLCRTELQELSEAIDLTVELYAYQDSRIILKEIIEPEAPALRLTLKVGDSHDLLQYGALSLQVLSFILPEEAWPQDNLWYYQQGKKKKVTGRKLVESINATRHDRVAYDEEFNEFGIRRFTAPIFSHDQSLTAILSIAQTWTPLADKDIHHLAQAAQNSASRLSDSFSKKGF